MTAVIASKRILMADDDVFNMRPTIDALEVAGAKVEVARSGADALAALRKRSFDLMILDIMMSAGEGIKVEDQGRSTGRVVYRIVREEISKVLPIVVSTVVSDPQVLRAFESDPRCRVILKPYAFAGLVQAIEAVIPK